MGESIEKGKFIMKDLLSIGEVSKIKGVSIKSLRYYEKIGVLRPAYINPDTGYRYYTVEQLLTVELILIFLELDIPLKNFEQYMTEKQDLDIQKLVQDGTKIVNEKMKKLKKRKQFLQNLSAHITRTHEIKKIKTEFIENLKERYFLITYYEHDLSDYKKIHMQYSKLIWQAVELGMPDQFNQGFFMVEQNGRYEYNIFLEIPKPHKEPENLYIVPSGKFLCHVVPFERFSSIQPHTKLCIVQELFDVTINSFERYIEVQELVYETSTLSKTSIS